MKAVITLCFCMAVLAWGSLFYGNSVYLLALVETHGWSVGEVSSAISLGFWLCAPSTLAVGWLFDACGRERGGALVVVAGAAFMAAGLGLLGSAATLREVYLAYALMGLAYPALSTPAISATLNLRAGPGYRRALTLALTGASVGGALAAPVLVECIARYGFASTLNGLALVVVCVIAVPALVVLRPIHGTGDSAVQGRATDAGALARSVKSTRFVRVALVAMLSLTAQVGFLAHQLSVLAQTLSATDAALVVSATAVSAVAGRFTVSAVAGRMGLRLAALFTYAVMAAGIATVAIAESAVPVIAGCLVMGFVVGAVVLLPPLLCAAHFESALYGRVYGLVGLAFYAGGGLGPALAGVLRDLTGDYRFALGALAAASVAAAVVVWSLRDADTQVVSG